MSLKDNVLGLYKKYQVNRTNGSSAPGQKHDGCEYFVLDLTHDKYSCYALYAYADACEENYPQLAVDLREKADKIFHDMDTIQ
jgi:hypothetical protein